MTKREKQLQLLRRKIKRAENDREIGIKLLVRATLELPRLRKQEARLETALLKRDAEIRRLSQLGPAKDEDEKETRRQLEVEVEAAARTQVDDLKIPEFLRRGQAAQRAADSAIADHVYEAAHAVANAHNKAPTEEQKKLVAQEKRKVREEHKHALLTGQKRKWPATGREATNLLK